MAKERKMSRQMIRAMALAPELHQRAFRFVWEHPGTQQKQVLLALGLHTVSAHSLLANLESQGLLLYEDAEGRLYPFDRDQLGMDEYLAEKRRGER